MKKLYLFFAVLCALFGSQTASAWTGGWTVYLKPGVWNTTGSPYFAICVHNNNQGHQWAQMTDSDNDGYYSATVPSGDWSNIVFCRVNPSTSFSDLSANSLSNSQVVWNQFTWGDPSGVNCAVMSDSDWNASASSSTYTPPTTNTWTVYFNDTTNWGTVYAYVWDASNESYKPLGSWAGTQMTKDDTSGYYKITFTATAMSSPSIIFNVGSNATQTNTFTLKNNYVYTKDGEQSEYTGGGSSGGDTGTYDYYLVMLNDGTTTEYGFVETDTEGTYTLDSSYLSDGLFDPTNDTGSLWIKTSSDLTYKNNGNYTGGEWSFHANTLDNGSYNLPYAYEVTLYGIGDNECKLNFNRKVEEDEITVSNKLNMPLKKRDFDNGKVHYFVVGTRMSEWRLQPEWELTDADGDGTYTLANRLLYTGMMGIAKVESYDDYIRQRYTFYAVNKAVAGTEDATLTLSAVTNPKVEELTITCATDQTKFTAINYGKIYTHGQFLESNTIIWAHGDTDLSDADILESQPTYVAQIAFTPFSSTLAFTGVSKDASTIAQYRTFSLVGSAITHDDYDDETTCATPLRNDGYGPVDWQEAWIQYDGYGKPYYDAYGNTLYQTVFQREWLKDHPTIFKASDGFEYNSINVVFNYNAARTHDATIPNTSDGEKAWKATGGANLYVNSKNENYSATVSNGNTWQCFEVENFWLGGEFKVWTGWGGADKNHDGSGTNKTDARWNYENGGHHIEENDWTITADKTIYYATERDKDGADFDLESRIFARYVRVWWDPSSGFTNSFIQLITEVGGPEISCKRNPSDSHGLQYTWSVPNAAEQLQNYDVKNIKIVRYRLDSNGKETSIVISDTPYAEDALNGANISSVQVSDKVDSNYAEGGWYWYKIIIDYYGNESAEEKTDFNRDAESNRVYIYYETIPNGATVTQLSYEDAEGNTRFEAAKAVDADDSGVETASATTVTEPYWSFDLAVNASAPETLQDKTYTNSEGNEVPSLSLVKYYVVGVPKQTEGTYTSVTSGGTTLTALTADEVSGLHTSSSNATTFATDKYTYFRVAPDTKNYYAMPEVILENVKPDSYLISDSKNFTVDMVSENGDDEDWKGLNISTAKPEVVMYVPSTSYAVSQFAISNAGTATAMTPDNHLGASTAQPVSYTKFNKLSTSDGKIKQLMVIDRVLTDWTVNYSLSAKVNNTGIISSAAPQVSDAGTLNDAAGVAAQFDYLPVAKDEVANTFNTGISKIDDWKTRQMDSEDFAVTLSMSYTRKATESARAVTTATQTATADVTINPVEDGNVTDYDKLAAYNAELATNGYTVHNVGAWSSQTINGEVIYFLDAFKVINLNNLNNSSNTLANAAGYYSGNGFTPSKTYYKETATAGYQPITRVDGGEVITDVTNYTSPFNAFSEYNSTTDNFAEYAATKGVLPIKIGQVGEGKAGVTSIDDLPMFSDIYTLVTAEYPFLVNPQLVSATATASEEETTSTANLVTLAYPTLIKAEKSNITTDIDNIAVDGASDFRIYPNPADNVVNVAASSALGRVEIYSVDGRLVKVVDVDDTRAAIEVADLVKGSYIIRAAGATQRMIKK